jgi:hypothetical protein
MKLMRPATQCPQLLGGFATIGRFGKALCATCQGLVGAKDQASRQRGCYRVRLGVRQFTGHGGRVASAGFGLYGSFIDVRRPYLEA